MEGTATAIKFVGNDYEIVKDLPIPQPGKGQVTIRVAFSTCNPVDKFIVAVNRKEGAILGSEGSGTIEILGEGVDPSLQGKKVSILGDAWCSHTVHNADSVVVHDDGLDIRQAANAMVNPLTAIYMLDKLQATKSKACIVTVASSQLCKQFNKLIIKDGYVPINIVRRDEHIETLKKECGAQYVLNQTSATFWDELKELIKEHKPEILYEFCGGEFSGKILELMPTHSLMYVLGNMTHTPLVLNSGDIIFGHKFVEGMTLYTWQTIITPERKQNAYQIVADDLRDGGKIFGSQIVKSVSYTQWKEALEEADSVATQGKILLEF